MEKVTPLSPDRSVLTFGRYLLSPSSRYENTKAGVLLSHWYTVKDHRAPHPRIRFWLPIFMFMVVRYCRCFISRTLRFIATRCSPLYEILCNVFYGLNILLDGAELQDGFLHFGAEQSPCFTVSAKFTFMLIKQTLP
jgi:hypothetical protein